MTLADKVTGYKRRALHSLDFRHTHDNVRYVQYFAISDTRFQCY